jgi:sialic acid synthase
MPSERGALVKMGKKLVAARALSAGHVLTEDDLAMKSPGDGLPPYALEQIVGRTLIRPLQPDDDISFEVLSQGEAE